MAVDTASVRNKVARIIGSVPNTNFGGSFTADYTNGPRNGLIDFTLSSGSGTITSIKLFMYMNNGYGGTGLVDARQLTRTAWTQAGVTWNKYDGTNSWTIAGGDYGAVISSTSVGTVNGWFSWDITSLGLTWGGDANIILLANASSQCDYDVTTNLPYIEITYTAGTSANGNMLALI